MRRAVKISLLRSTFPFVTFLLSSDQFKSLAAAGPSTTRDAHTNQGRAFFLELPHRHLPCSDRQLVLTEPDVRDFPPINKRSYYVTWCGCFATPDIDSITVPTTTTQYLADAARFNGKDISIVASPEGTDGKKLAVSTGGNYTVTFDVSVVNAGTTLGADSVSLRFAGIGKGESQFFEGNDSEFPFDQREPQRFHGRRSGQREPGPRSRLEYGHDFVDL